MSTPAIVRRYDNSPARLMEGPRQFGNQFVSNSRLIAQRGPAPLRRLAATRATTPQRTEHVAFGVGIWNKRDGTIAQRVLNLFRIASDHDEDFLQRAVK